MSKPEDRIISAEEFFRTGEKSMVETPNQALLKPFADEGVEDRNGTLYRFAFMEVVKPGPVAGRLQSGMTSQVAIDRTGTTNFIAF